MKAAVVLIVVISTGVAAWVWARGSIGSLPIRPHCTATVNGVSLEFDPDQTGSAATITTLAVQRGLPARAASIAIATAIQESKLRNIKYGDRDSLGLFQQRPSQGWGTPEQILDPVYATGAFYDALVEVDGYQDLPITVAAQKVQRSAYPEAYADHEPEARVYASALTGHSPGSLTCVLMAPQRNTEQVRGADGLTARARVLTRAASRETGRSGVAADTTGSTLRYTTAGRTGIRLAWSLAHWAVARAYDLDVVRVQVDGQEWRRSRPDQGWTKLPEGPSAGTVIVQVANGT
ncbi:MAG: hypothetical protein QG608_2104 [Actinomycetota bacterium]|nr:hypothetical protein [Actinomycetota bacterium]